MIFEDDDFEPIREHLARNIGYRFRDRGLGRGCPLREGKRPGGLRRERRDERNNKRENYKDSFHINSALLFRVSKRIYHKGSQRRRLSRLCVLSLICPFVIFFQSGAIRCQEQE